MESGDDLRDLHVNELEFFRAIGFFSSRVRKCPTDSLPTLFLKRS